MKLLLTIILLFLATLTSYSQCNTSHSSEIISIVESSCNGVHINGTINNTIAISSSCGDLRFTPPMVDIRDYTGMGKVELPYELSIYPNPFVEGINISLAMDLNEYRVSIFNLLGQAVMPEFVFRTGDSHFIRLGHLQAGTYFIQVQTFDKVRKTQKIIKIY